MNNQELQFLIKLIQEYDSDEPDSKTKKKVIRSLYSAGICNKKGELKGKLKYYE